MLVKTIAGSSVKIYINDKLFGIGEVITWDIEHNVRPIYSIDSILPQELAPGQALISGTLRCLRLKNDGGVEGRGIMANFNNMLLSKYNKITLIERSTNTLLVNISQCLTTSQNWDNSARGIVRGSFSFMGINYSNEAG